MRILFVGPSWNGSSARSLREALSHLSGMEIEDVSEDCWVPKHRLLPLKCANRLLRPLQRAEFEREIVHKLSVMGPDVLLVYKGVWVNLNVLRNARAAQVMTVNVFPDCSPHAQGRLVRAAMGKYDLVVSTKPFHRANWRGVYGYSNECVFVPHGYDPRVHLWEDVPREDEKCVDVVLAATWRQQYERLMCEVADQLGCRDRSVSIIGSGWQKRRRVFPKGWRIAGPLAGRSYGEWARKGRIVVAPVHGEVSVGGRVQPGDEDTTRTYELAAAGCFFIHRRTPYVEKIYDESSEVPLFGDARELVKLIEYYIPRPEERRAMAVAAHRRAVPAYSIASRAEAVRDHIEVALRRYRAGFREAAK